MNYSRLRTNFYYYDILIHAAVDQLKIKKMGGGLTKLHSNSSTGKTQSLDCNKTNKKSEGHPPTKDLT